MNHSVILSERFFGGTSGWRVGRGLVRTLKADTPSEIPELLTQLDASLEAGLLCAGFLTYEAAGGVDPALVTHSGESPLGWFACCEAFDPVENPFAEPPQDVAWVPDTTRAEYRKAVGRIRSLLESGDTYQVNHTFRLLADDVNPEALMSWLLEGQADSYAAWLDTGDQVICSVSPELFLSVSGDQLTMKPMKGTRPRGAGSRDRDLIAELATSEKDRAENLMIVDMTRNDLGRVAEPGSVQVPRLFEIESHPTVHQMTSTVTATSSRPLSEILRAVFPAASITGAPKVRTMEIIRSLESSPRGVYTGLIGVASREQSLFNVGIRTAVVQRDTGDAVYGIGSGIVWDSDPEEEWRECLLKSAILGPAFDLIETLKWTPDGGYFLLERHLDRLTASALEFAFGYDEAAIRRALREAAEPWTTPMRVRLTVDRTGRTKIEATALVEMSSPLKVVVHQAPVDARNLLLRHKTTYRKVYEQARASHSGADEVLLMNERSEITEGTIFNLIAKIDGRWITPADECGLLPGTLRQELLESGQIEEGILRWEDLKNADGLELINSVRGRVPAVLLGD